jgi:hypothetical protein
MRVKPEAEASPDETGPGTLLVERTAACRPSCGRRARSAGASDFPAGPLATKSRMALCLACALILAAPASILRAQSSAHPAAGESLSAAAPVAAGGATESGDAPDSPAPDPAALDAQQAAGDSAASRTGLNLLGQVDTSSGEARRNENVRITLIDNNVLKELSIRMGITATIVEEFSAGRNYFGAEFGANPSTPVHVTPSPVSGVHGQLHFGHNNSVFSARSFFQAGSVKPAHENDYGFTVGVPLWSKAGLTIEGGRNDVRGSVNGNVLVPRADERTPLATDPATREMVARILAAYPAELPNRTDIDPRALNTNAPQRIDNDNIGATLDQAAGERDRFTLQYRFTSQNVEAFQLVGGQNPDTTTKSHRARVTWNRAWSPLTTADFSVGFDRVGSLLLPEESSLGPQVLTGFVIEFLGPNGGIPIDRAENSFRYAGRLRRLAGGHTLSAGFELLRRQVNGSESSGHRGTFSFGDDFGRDAITNIRLGAPRSYTVAIGDTHRGFRNWDSQYYVSDEWRVGRNLTLNLGLRYRPVTAPIEVNGLSEVPFGCDCNNVAPRFGFAYRLGSRSVLRGAYGIQYGEIFPVTFGQARFNPPANIRISVDVPDLVDPLQDLGPEDFAPDARSGIFRFAPDLVAPYSHQYNFSWQLALPAGWQLDLGYVGSRSHRLFLVWWLNRAELVPGVEPTSDNINDRRPDPNYFEIRNILNGSRGYFDAAKATLTIPYWRGISGEASYWFSKTMDLGGHYMNTASGRDGRLSVSPAGEDAQGQMRGLSDFDQPHAFLWRLNYDTPPLPAQPSWVRAALGGWSVSAVILRKSGTPFNVIAGSDSPGNGNVDGAGGDRPNILDPAILGRAIDHPDTSTAMLPAAAFAFIQPEERAGNLGRNTFRKDGIWNVNAGLSRSWPLGGDKSLLLRAESINLLNTPQFAEPGLELTSPNFGQITNTLNDGRSFRFRLQLGF